MSDYEARADQHRSELAHGDEHLHVEAELTIEEYQEWLAARSEPTEQQVMDWNIHNDHAEGNEEDETWLEREGFEHGEFPFELAPAGGWGGEI